ncbi:cation:proton antiporter [Legionella taurinensis]|uniref:Cation:proton antiporter n=1 Tax=Legionella taurinensis TaxID=70611 RepID=A0A3A5LE87_9GAMM|nr:cation:proton antiporter [Legionella taurinensis]MDX1837963.1 cation:proton antiporter [Legionella taurinensis]PUT39447.1 cation:proton antiporter [Legionella taurinensis]PUT41756.1 cation:proton antiporter [Legionella taurinensis]PUT44590.1 cation:proton antiporter [Legionella taurinensis]PUT46834.1 cation:proton antiporter [Legionella taurinensis]
MKRLSRLLLIAAACFPALVFAGSNTHEQDPLASVIFWVSFIFIFALLGRYLAKRFNQAGVLGELILGVVLGNVCYFFGLKIFVVLREGSAIFHIMRSMLDGVSLTQAVKTSIPDPVYAKQMLNALTSPDGIELIKAGYVLDILSRFGVLFLLFMVGLESSLQDLKKTGRESVQVAIIGVVVPIILGFVVAHLLLPEASYKADLFVAATLSATSIGITARVLSEMKKLKTREARTILGAAMLDDVLGLMILAIVSSIVVSGEVEVLQIVWVLGSALVFFTVAVLFGPWALRQVIRFLSFLDVWEAKLFASFFFLMTLAWLATVMQLAAIIGAFAAGLVIHDGFFEVDDSERQYRLDIKQLIAPFEAILAPLFFMLIGIQVKLESFYDWRVLAMAGALTLAAIVGKLVSGLGGNKKDDRLLIGIGMLPRGEVGLVFASIGRTLGVISDNLFSAIILMVILTTLIAPPWLKMQYARQKKLKVSQA